MAEKSLENESLAKGSNSCKSRSSMTKLELELYYVMTNSYTKFEVSSQYLQRRQRNVRKTKFSQRAIAPVKASQA